MKMKKFVTSLLAFCLLLSLVPTAFALEYSFDEEDETNYGKPTSVEVVQTPDGGAMKNEDISKNAALIPPTFGSATSNTLNTGDYLTPNLAPNAMPATGATINGDFVVVFPPDMSGLSAESVPADPSVGNTVVPGSADVTVIPAIKLKVGIFEGTDAATLKLGAGHFEDSSIWDGNVGLAAHNRGTNNYFGQIHTLELGDTITLTTKLGTRTYEVSSVSKVSETDRSALAASQSNVITLYTCVRDERDFRWCVTGQEIG